MTLIWIGLALALAGLALSQYQIYRLKRRQERLLIDDRGHSLEQILTDHLAKVKLLDQQTKTIASTLKINQETLRLAFQKMSMVRFNPFDDSGGDQSFSLAVLDHFNSGFVITSMHARGTARVYCKPIESGTSTYPLSREESQAVKSAIGNTNHKE